MRWKPRVDVSRSSASAARTTIRPTTRVECGRESARRRMGARVRARARANCGQRQVARRKNCPLRRNAVQPGVQRRYDFAVWYFAWFCAVMFGGVGSTTAVVAWQVCDFLETCWEYGEPKSIAADTLSGVQNALGVKKCFAGAWRLLTICSRLEQPSRAAPLPEGVALAMSGVCLSTGCHDTVLCILLGFDGLLRTAEVLGFRACHVNWNDNLSRVF